MKNPLLVTTLICACIHGPLITKSDAAILMYEARDVPFAFSFNISGITANPGGRFSNNTTDANIRLSIDTVTSQITVDEVRVRFSTSGANFTSVVTTGFGQSSLLNFNLQAQPFEFLVTGGQPGDLTPTVGGNFSTPGFRSADSISADPIQVDYDISSSTDTVFGTTSPQSFQQTTMFATLNVNGGLDTNGFPDRVTLGSLTINAGNPSPSIVTVNEMIDGDPFSFQIATGFFNVTARDIQLSLVPEPSSSLLLLAACISCLLRRVR